MTTASSEDFTLGGLQRLLGELKRAGYRFCDFTPTVDPSEPVILLRHDVDLDLSAAVQLAALESASDVRATFFFLLTSDIYNLRSRSGRAALLEVVALGHAIGVHFDASLDEGASTLEPRLIDEQQMLEDLAQTSVNVFSLHKPGPDGTKPFDAGPLQSAYADRFFRDIGYVSDSMGFWRFGTPAEQSFFEKRRAGQLVVHPIWWTSDQPEHPAVRLERLRAEQDVAVTASLCATVKPYGAWRSGDTGYKWAWPAGMRSVPNTTRKA